MATKDAKIKEYWGWKISTVEEDDEHSIIEYRKRAILGDMVVLRIEDKAAGTVVWSIEFADKIITFPRRSYALEYANTYLMLMTVRPQESQANGKVQGRTYYPRIHRSQQGRT